MLANTIDTPIIEDSHIVEMEVIELQADAYNHCCTIMQLPQ